MIKIDSLSKRFGENIVLNNFSLDMADGEVIAVIGPSGTGKSTLLRCLNYLEEPCSGTIQIGDVFVDSTKATKKDIHALRRQSAMVFQNYNLFQNKTALENIMEPMIVAHQVPKEEARARAMEILEMINLPEKADSYPSQLSGGQQQRIGIGRAMGTTPQILLLDEPTSSLDPELIGEVLAVIRSLAEQKVSMLITTHEMEFAKQIAHRVIFLEHGEIVEEGTPTALFEHAENERTRQFLKRYYEGRLASGALPHDHSSLSPHADTGGSQ